MRDRKPAAAHATRIQPGAGSAVAIFDGFLKIPLPMMEPIRMEAALRAPSTLGSSPAAEAASVGGTVFSAGGMGHRIPGAGGGRPYEQPWIRTEKSETEHEGS